MLILTQILVSSPPLLFYLIAISQLFRTQAHSDNNKKKKMLSFNEAIRNRDW